MSSRTAWRWRDRETEGDFAGCQVTIWFSVVDEVIQPVRFPPSFLVPWVGRSIMDLIADLVIRGESSRIEEVTELRPEEVGDGDEP